MIEDFSEENIKKNCPHCHPASFGLVDILVESKNFYIFCDPHPLTEGHLLIIPKKHLSCIGEYSNKLMDEFIELDKLASNFLAENYGSVSSFEHGKFGQTVYHSHVHYLPFNGSPKDIIPEGGNKIYPFENIKELKDIFQKDGGYLYFSIGSKKWTVDKSLTASRFFRDRYAKALNHPKRGNWKAMHFNEEIMKVAQEEIKDTKIHWKQKF